MKNNVLSGLLLFVAGVVALMGIITAEVFYPEEYSYTTKLREISDLGATRLPEGLVTQPSSSIFNLSMIASGALIISGSHFLRKGRFNSKVSFVLSVLGVGIFLVGIFPGNKPPWHALAAMTTFISGGLAGIITGFYLKAPLKQIYIAFGLTTLICLFLASKFIPILGFGGTERWVVYPVIIYIISFSSYLIGKHE